jgi:arylsulfatase A-like enzyme
MRVPCIVRWPGRIAAGRTTSALATSLDLLPTLAAFAGAELPGDRDIDGVDIGAVLLDDEPSPRESFWYYAGNTLAAVRVGRWKLHLARVSPRGTERVQELYDLDADVAETTDVAAAHPGVVADLLEHAERARAELGDASKARTGAGVRPVGRVSNPTTLTTFDPDHPYYAGEYDLSDRG